MPRYEYRFLAPRPEAEKAFLKWIADLDQQFADRDPDRRSEVVRDTLHQLYLGRQYDPRTLADVPLGPAAMVYNFDPRNATLEPEYYGDVDAAKYAERKPLIWFWMMFDRSPLGLNHWLGFRLRHMLARHVFKHIGNNVRLFHGIEFSFGYNLTVEDNCTIHKYVLLDDRGELIVHAGSSISDYANVYSHEHDINDGMIVENQRTEIGPRARVTYHATVMSGVKVGEHGLVGSMGVATRDVPDFTIAVGVPAKGVKVKPIAPDEVKARHEAAKAQKR